MKSLQFALILALLLPAAGGDALALSRSAAHSATPRSFKSGFSSQKALPTSVAPARSGFGSFGSATPAPAAPSAVPGAKPSFGSFGKAADTGVSAPAKSALTKNLDTNAANANALRTLDERKAAAAAAAAPVTAPVTAGMPAPQYNPAPQPLYHAPQPIIVQQRSGMGDMFMGFMLGRALSGGHNNGSYNNGSYNNGGNGAYVSNGSTSSSAAAMGNVEQPASSFGAKVLRTFLWLVILGAIGWLIYFGVRSLTRSGARNAPNYSFERE
jgi:hypothetical protein